jgi:hypothetical protein
MFSQQKGAAMEFIALVAGVSEDTFLEVVNASPRRIRETLFGRLGIKAKKKGVGVKVHGKLEERTKKLHERLREGASKQENDLCEELLRNWLYTQRPLLKATLDWLEVKNDNGLIEEEPSFFQELEEAKVKALVEHLRGEGFADEHMLIYLRFVNTPHLDELAQKAA